MRRGRREGKEKGNKEKEMGMENEKGKWESE